jgi:formate hydrogenlyase subunit 6/NADH:ubiquinone oxidoreductase subunit I
MSKDLSQTNWHGIPRKEIPWFPTVDVEKCIGCELCFVTCGREVYEIAAGSPRKARVERAYNCMVGCSTCAVVCPTMAIAFPPRDLVWKVEREHKIFNVVRKEAAEKRTKLQPAQARERAEEQLRKMQTRARIEIAGEFGDKAFLLKLEAKVKDRPFDIVNLKLEVPTVKGLLEKTPAYMTFELISTEQKDVGGFLSEIRDLVRENGLVWVRDIPV